MPYPGVAPPWYVPSDWMLAGMVGTDATENMIANVPSNAFTMVTVKHQLLEGEAAMAPPIAVRGAARPSGPSFDGEFVFIPEGMPIELHWATNEAVDHYNLYRFDSTALAARAYHAYYDSGYAALTVPPKDSFSVADKQYYYYAMTPYQVIAGGMNTFTDYGVAEGTAYLVTSVNASGYESEFSAPIEVVRVPERDKDILLLTHGIRAGSMFMDYTKAKPFYDSVLAGYDYDIYNWADSNTQGINTDWHLLMEYRLVIIDDELAEQILNKNWETTTKAYTRYLLSGGKLAYFGAFVNFTGLNMMTGVPTDKRLDAAFLRQFFGIDSIHFVPAAALFTYVWPYEDTVYAFNQADGVSSEWGPVIYDLNRQRIHPGTLAQRMWPTNAPLSVATFKLTDSGEVTHLFSADPAVTSLAQGKPVGVRSFMDSVETYAFGFRLWYMETSSASGLIGRIMERNLAVQAAPDTIKIGEGWVISPETLEVRIGNLPNDRSVYDIDAATVRVVDSVVPWATEYRGWVSGFDGDVLVAKAPAAAVVERLGAMYGARQYSLGVSGAYTGGEGFALGGAVIIAGPQPGDVNASGSVNVADLTATVNYLFRGGAPEREEREFDVTGDCQGNLSDLTATVAWLFRGGAPLVWCGAR